MTNGIGGDIESFFGWPAGKQWPEMTRQEKLAAYDELNRAFQKFAEECRLGFDELLAMGGCTLRTDVKVIIDVNPNDDPRLP